MTSTLITALNETIDLNGLMSFFGTVLSTFVSDLLPHLITLAVFGLVVDLLFRGGNSIIGSITGYARVGPRRR